MNSWVSVNTRNPEIGQEVLVFCQGYDVSGTKYWSDYEIGTYIENVHDKRQRVFAQTNSIRREKDGRVWDIGWIYSGVTHWMSLPEAPKKIELSKCHIERVI